MSLWRDDVPAPLPAIVPVVGVFAVAMLSLSRVFASGAYLAWAIPAAAAGWAFGLAFGRRSLGVGFALMGAIAVVTLPALFARDLTFYLVPTRAAFRLVGTLLGSGLSGMMREEAPVPADPRYLVVLWTAALTMGFLAASWVVVERPIGAAVTSLGLIAYTGTVGRGPGRGAYAFSAVVLLCGYLLLDGQHRIAMWSRAARIPASFGTATLAAACLASLAGPAVLGATRPWLRVESTLRPRLVIIKPLSDIKRQLEVDPPIEVMRVLASSDTYWRLAALDRYDGRQWVLEAKPHREHNGPLPPPDPPTSGEVLRQEYTITSLLAPWLPAAFAADRIDAPVIFDLDGKTSTLLLGRDRTIPGLRYTVESRLPSAASVSLSRTPLGKPDPEAQPLAAYARSVTSRARTPLEQALDLQAHFRTFRYSEDVPAGHSIRRLQQFLAQRTGYCEQFAAAMTLMLRSLGTPARVAVGFLPGRRQSGQFVVTTKEAHAWVEAELPGMGWVSFDPTPGRGLPAGAEGAAQLPTPGPPTIAPVPAGATPVPSQRPQVRPPAPVRRPVPVLPLAATAVVVGAVPGAKLARRQARRRGSTGAAVLGAYAELLDGAADLGWTPLPAETQWEAWARAFADGRAPGAEPAAGLVDAAARALYGSAPPSAQDAARAWQALGPALRGLRARTPWWRRLSAPFDPRTFVPARSPAARLAGA